MSLVVTGTIGIDTVQTPSGEKREGILGGSCAYFSAAAQHHGKVNMVAAVGDDFPDEHRAVLNSLSNLDQTGLEVRKGSKTFRWGGKYHENMDHRDTTFTDLNVLEEGPPKVPESYRDSRYVFLANGHPAVQLGMLEQFPDCTLSVADTMDLWIDIARADLDILIGKVDGLVLNFDEAEQLTGHKNTVSAAKHILEMGPRFVVVKKGEHGCLFVCRDESGIGIGALPAFPAEHVVDPTGAGDSFAGGMMGYLAHAADESKPFDIDTLKVALAHGTVMASFTIETFSLDRLASLTPAELAERFDEFSTMLRVH
ncbi:MAG TPA: sugar kinase [Phycisphaerales bacterium]|nr:sugar kinase [Phycisphaerales bacterium]